MPTNLERLYSAGSEQFDLGGFDTFSSGMSKPVNRQKFYSALSRHYDLGDYETFDGKVMTDLRPQGEIAESPMQQAEAQPQTPRDMVSRFMQESAENDPLLSEIDRMVGVDLFAEEPEPVQAEVEPEPEQAQIVSPSTQSSLESLGEGFVAGMYDTASFPFTVARAVAGKIGGEGAVEVRAKKVEDFLQKKSAEHPMAKELEGKNLWDNPEIILDPRYTLYGIGNMTPAFLAAMIPGGAALKFGKLAASAVGGAAGGLMEGVNTYRETLDRGGDKDEAFKNMLLMTTGSGVLNAIGFGKLLSKYEGKALIQATAAALTEGITEYAEEPLEATILDMPADEFKQKMKDGLAVIGPAMFMGGAGGAASQYVQKAQQERAKKLETEAKKSGDLAVQEQAIRERKVADEMKQDFPEAEPEPSVPETPDIPIQETEVEQESEYDADIEDILSGLPGEDVTETTGEAVDEKTVRDLDRAAAELWATPEGIEDFAEIAPTESVSEAEPTQAIPEVGMEETTPETAPTEAKPEATAPETEATNGESPTGKESLQVEATDKESLTVEPQLPDVTYSTAAPVKTSEVPAQEKAEAVTKEPHANIDDVKVQKDVSKEKQYFEMDLVEFAKAELIRMKRPETAAQIKISSQAESFRAQHRKNIANALERGDAVPASVLADYPDLAAKFVPKTGTNVPEKGTRSAEVSTKAEKIDTSKRKVAARPSESDLILASSNRPFKTEKAAQTYGKKKGEGYTVVPVEGGFALKPPVSTAEPKAEERKAISQEESDRMVDEILDREDRERQSWEEDVPAKKNRGMEIRFRSQQGQTETPEFKAWFGKSKVVDADGKPQAMHHASHSPVDFTVFKPGKGDIGMHFGTSGQAKDRFDYVSRKGPSEYSRWRTYPVYLKIENPLRLRDAGWWDKENVGFELERAAKDKPILRGISWNTMTISQVRSELKSLGYDGIVYRNTGEVSGSEPYIKRSETAHEQMMESQKRRGRPLNVFDREDQKTPEYQEHSLAQKEYADFREKNAEDSYIVFSPKQVKSATGNIGSFDPTNPDIRFSAASATSSQPGMGVIEAEKALAPLKARLRIPVDVYGGIEDLPDGEEKEAARLELRKGNIVSGYYNPKTGRIVAFADNIRNENELLYEVMSHEIAHFGVEGVLGEKGYARFKNNLQKDKYLSPAIRKLAKENNWSMDYAAGEWFASQGEGKNLAELPNRLRDRIIYWLREALRYVFGTNRIRFTKGEMDNLLRRSWDYATSGKAEAVAQGETQFKTQSMPDLLRQLKEVYNALDELPAVRSGQTTSGIRQRLEAKAAELESKIQSGEMRFKSTPSGPRLKKEIARLEAGLEKLPEEERNEIVKHRYSTLIRDQIKAIKQGHLIGGRDMKESLGEVKSFILNYAREYLPKQGITRGQVKPLLTSLAQADNADKVMDAYDKIDRITRTVTSKALVADISKLLKKYKTVKKDGKISGKLVADEQRKLNDIISIVKMKPEDVQAELERVFTGMVERAGKSKMGGEPTEFEAEYIRRLQTFGDLRNKTVEQLQEAKEELTSIIETGRTKRIAKDEARRKVAGEVAEKGVDIFTSGKGTLSEETVQSIVFGNKKLDGMERHVKRAAKGEGGFGQYFKSQDNFEYLMDRLSKFERGAKPLHGFLNKTFMPLINASRNAETAGVRKWMETSQTKMAEIFGTSNADELMRIGMEHTIPQDTGIKIKKDKTEETLILSQNQAYKKWQEWQDPTLAETFKEMNYTQDTINALEKFIKPEVKAWAEWQLYEFYPQYYATVNAVFRERYGVDLPYNPYYTPISRRYNRQNKEDDQLLAESESEFASAMNRHLLGRVKNNRALRLMDGDSVLVHHILQMEHFKAWSETMRTLRSFFGKESVRTAIKQYHGNYALNMADKFLNNIARGGVDPQQVSSGLDALRANFTTAVLGLNLTLIPKQMVSFPAYWAEIPTTDYFEGMLDFVTNAKHAVSVLKESEMLKARYGIGFDRDIMLAWRKTAQHQLAGKRNWRDVAMLPTKIGDQAAILMGGWSVYKYHYDNAIKAGKLVQEAKDIAMYEFEMSTNRSQQAGNPENLPMIMQGHSLTRLFTMFQTAPASYMRITAAAIRNLKYGRGGKAENLKRLGIAWVFLPLLFQFVSNGFRWRDDEELTALIVGSLNGLLVVGPWIGNAVSPLVSRSMGARSYFYGVGDNPVFENMETGYRGAERLVKTVAEQDYTWKDITFVLDHTADFMSKILGVPYEPFSRATSAVYGMAKKRRVEPMKLIGYSDYALGQRNPKQELLKSLESFYETPKAERSDRELNQLKAEVEDYNKSAFRNDEPLITKAEQTRMSREPKDVALELLNASGKRVLGEESVKDFRRKLKLALEHKDITQQLYDRWMDIFERQQERQQKIKDFYYERGQEVPRNRQSSGAPRPPRPPQPPRPKRRPIYVP